MGGGRRGGENGVPGHRLVYLQVISVFFSNLFIGIGSTVGCSISSYTAEGTGDSS